MGFSAFSGSVGRLTRVAQRNWRGSGSRYTILWGKQPWTLELAADHPGMQTVNRPDDCVLALGGIAAVGSCDSSALNGNSLIKVERIADRVEATYLPSRWAGLQVRARWGPISRYDGIDLEIQVSASTVGELRGLETTVFSRVNAPGATPTSQPSIWVRPRDSRSACFSYDGRVREADLRRLTTLPLVEFIEPDTSHIAALGPDCNSEGRYLELAHPRDVARKIFQGLSPVDQDAAGRFHVRYALIGHDLEKGVVIRARIRGLWISGDDIAAALPLAARDFLEAPLPLGP
jgi:hypothetical protein